MLTMLIMAALSILTVSALELLTTSMRITGNHKRELEAIYVADAGIEDAVKELRNDRDWRTGFNNKDFLGSKYTVTLTQTSTDAFGNPIIKIESTGTTTIGFQRKLEAEVKVVQTPELALPYSVVMNYWKEV